MTGFTRLIVLGLVLTAFAQPADAMTWARAVALARAFVSQHNRSAFVQLQDAATQGDPAAGTVLGVMYQNGKGVTPNLPLAFHWYRLAAHQGYAPAQTNLGFMYQQGQGVTPNLPLAVHWYRLAAQQGDAVAQFNLGNMYNNGKGVTQNLPLAVHWYQLAAHQGYAPAQDNLGIMYAKGRGVTQNFPTAVHWFQLAARQGYKPAIERLRALQQQMRRTAHAQPVQTPAAAPTPAVAQRASAAPPIPDRQQSLRNLQRFWTLYFQAAHAHLVDFGAPALVQPVGFSAAHP